ncbi:patatin-like protein [Streptomyces sp. NPDC060035]|uniref:patatin-like protein n=1 Tax=Streptomyces sp. NPDC060035 TaxID=3347044 RepID=UPI0036C11803
MSRDMANKQGAITHERSELRLAATFTGGVSLAVWMGGVAREMNLLAGACRSEVSAPTAQADQQVRAKYRQLLDLLMLDVSIDVLSGTSAGGINAAFLGLSNVRKRDMGGLRDLWLNEGSLSTLLREPSEQAPPSLLHGDNVLLKGLNRALKGIINGAPAAPSPEGTTADDPTRVFITTTLLDGVESTHRDDYGTAIRDTTHRGLFTFDAQQLGSDVVVDALALAARSSASFPGAFEPAFVPVGTAGRDGHPDMAPYVSTDTRTQFCADGGLLANRPLGPALQAVFERPADREVRRVLAYVVPSPGLVAPSMAPPPRQDDIPAMGPALLADVNALQSQSITAELKALAAHNERARTRQRAESRLALLAGEDGELAAGGLDAEYRAVCARQLAGAAANETLRQLASPGALAADGRPVGFGADLDTLAAAAATAITGSLPSDLSGDDLFNLLARFGRPALDGAKATVLRLVRGGFAADPQPDVRGSLGAFIAQVHNAMQPVHDAMPAGSAAASMRERLSEALAASMTLPADATVPTDEISQLAASDEWRNAVCSQLPSAAEQAALADAWRALARVVLNARQLLLQLLPPESATAADITGVLVYLTGAAPEASLSDETVTRVARRLFDLQAAQQVMYPDEPAARQAVELVQMSADTRTLLDTRSLAEEKLTGLQLHHFGAFYKSSWRANDWMWGRLDGAGWLVHVLLFPRLLARLANDLGDTFGAKLEETLLSIAGSEPPPGVFVPFPDGKPAELTFLTAATGSRSDLPASLPVTSMWVASGLQRIIAAEELSCVARQAKLDTKKGTADSADAFLAAYEEATKGPAGNGPLPPDRAADLLGACQISRETFADERGTKLLTRTIVQSAAVVSNAIEAGTARWKSLRPLFGTVSRTLRLTHQVLRPEAIGGKPLAAGMLLIGTGAIAATSTITLIGILGLAAVLGGVVLLSLTAPSKRIRTLVAGLAVAAVAVLALAGFIRPAGDHLFPWLGDTAVPYLSDHPWLWTVVVVLLLLPPVWMVTDSLRAARARRNT